MKEGDHHHQPEHGGDLELGNASSIDRSSLQAVMESVSLSKLTHYGGVTGMLVVPYLIHYFMHLFILLMSSYHTLMILL